MFKYCSKKAISRQQPFSRDRDSVVTRPEARRPHVDELDPPTEVEGEIEAETEPKDACSDISSIDRMLSAGLTRSVELYRPSDAAPGFLHFIIFSAEDPAKYFR